MRKICHKICWEDILCIIRYKILIICTGVCCYQSYTRFIEFLNEPISAEEKWEQQLTVTFPSVTICPGYPRENRDNQYAKFWVEKCKSASMQDCSNVEEKAIFDKPFKELNFTPEEVWDSLREFKKSEIKTFRPCPEHNHAKPFVNCESMDENADEMNEEIIRTIWGNCITLSPKIPFVHRGPYTILKIAVNTTDRYQFYLYNVHSKENFRPHRIPFGEHLRSEEEKILRLTSKTIHRQNTGKNPCTDETKRASCENQHVDKILEEKLICALPFTKSTRLRACKNFNEMQNALNSAVDIYSTLNYSKINCPRLCSESLYALTIDNLGSSPNGSTSLSLYYADNIRVVVTERLSYPLGAFLSDLGGTLGLYLGFSVWSVANSLYCSLRKFFIKRRERKINDAGIEP